MKTAIVVLVSMFLFGGVVGLFLGSSFTDRVTKESNRKVFIYACHNGASIVMSALGVRANDRGVEMISTECETSTTASGL